MRYQAKVRYQAILPASLRHLNTLQVSSIADSREVDFMFLWAGNCTWSGRPSLDEVQAIGAQAVIKEHTDSTPPRLEGML